MNVSRKTCDRFAFPSVNMPKGEHPYFQTVRMRQKRDGRQIPPDESVQCVPKEHMSIPGSIQFPSASRSDTPRSSAGEFSMKFFSTPATSGRGAGGFLSALRSSSDSAWSFGAFPSKSVSAPRSASSAVAIPVPTFRTPVSTPARLHNTPAITPSGVSKNRSVGSTSSDGEFFATPNKSPAVRTPKSRTPKSSSSNFSESSNTVVVAITEGRGHARGEVGIASIDIKRPILTLCEISDTQTYVNTLSKINILNPSEILVPNTFYDSLNPSKLYQMISDNFPNCNLRTVQRKFFNENNGLQQVQSICSPEFSSVLLVVSRKCYALAAAAAVLKFAEFEQNMIFSPRSMRINFESGNNITFIDLETARKLELVVSQNTGNLRPENTLYGILNKCSTISGQRRLRALILQPSTDEVQINKRLDCVEELVNNHNLFISIKSILPKFEDVEQLLSISMQLANLKDSSKCVEMQINFMLMLKTTLEAVPLLRKSLENGKANFFISFFKNLDNSHYNKMLERIHEVINSDAHISPKFDVCQLQRCFCIRTGIDSFLDVARLAFTELIEDFNAIAEHLSREYKINLTIKTLKNKGPVLQMKLSEPNFNIKDLPSVFVQVEKSRSCVTMTTKELLYLKERMNNFVQEIQTLTSAIIFDLTKSIREYMGCLFILCENIAELDLLACFAQSSSSFNFVRPSFSLDCLNLKQSEHPIIHRVCLTKPIPNDVFASIDCNMSIITGPNMGGKSIYIRQIALLQIMAQIGCFIPAESAQFRITDRIFSRIGFSDDMECNASTFIVELKEINYILKTLTPRSLVIIDELCRGTSVEEGASIAWAILEELLASTAFIFVTTHFLFLTKLEELYCNVSNWHFDTLEINSEDATAPPNLVYTHRLVPGIMKLENYGLKLAKVTAISDDILQAAEEIMKTLTAEWKATSSFEGNIQDCKIIDTVVLKLMNMLDNDILTLAGVRDMVSYAAEMSLNLGSTDEPNGDEPMETVSNGGSPAHVSETDDNWDEDVQNNTVLQINIFEGDDGVRSEDEVNTFQDIGGSENFDNSLRLEKSSQMNDEDLYCDEMNSCERTRAELESPSNFVSLGAYSNSLLRNGYVNNRSSSQSRVNLAEVDPALEDSGVEYSDDEASCDENSQIQFFSYQEELLLDKSTFSAAAEYASGKEKRMDCYSRADKLFYSV